MNITVVTTAANDDVGMDLLRFFGMPFKQVAEAPVAAGR
jgi:hypothetical protein